MRKQFRLFAMAAAVVMMATPNAAQYGTTSSGKKAGTTTSASTTTSSEKTTLSAADQKFAKAAAQGGIAEVELGRLAAMTASNPDVRQFGQRMVDDHSKANMQLSDVAHRKNFTLPAQPTGKQRSEYERLAKLSGAQFDREYVHLMLADHKEDVTEFRKQATAAKDEDLRSFAAQTLPTLEQHLTMVEQLSGKDRATSTSGHSSESTRPAGTSGSSDGR